MDDRNEKQLKAVGLMSGGLDSTLAARVLAEQGVEVIGLHFNTGFCTTDHRRAIGRKNEDPRRLRNEALRAGADAGVDVRIIDVADEYLEMVKHPKHGYGAAANPCIDCRIFMLNKAKEIASREGAEVVFTGEVLGQRPMSQHRRSLDLIERETGLEGRLLRPLSAKHLPATRAENEGRLDRSRLLGIKGRSRKDQVREANRFEIDEYPQPSGGCCFLADRNFGKRFHDLVREETVTGRTVGREEIMLLKVGRHFRLSPKAKAVVGRDEGENNFLERFVPGRWRLAAMDHLGPVTLVQGQPVPADIETAAAITARYCDGKDEPAIRVQAALHAPDEAADGGSPEAGGERVLESAIFEVSRIEEQRLAGMRVGL